MLETLGIAVAAIIALPVAGMVYQKLGAAADLRRHPPPGRLVDVGGHRLHIQTKGNGELGRPPKTGFGQPVRPVIQ